MRFSRYLILFILLACPAVVHAQRERLSPEDLAIVQKLWPNAKRTSTGLRYVVLSEGKGDLAKPGDLVQVVYTGWFLDGTLLDQYIDATKPFEFRLGRNKVIEGWDQALQLMRPGERCLFIIPYELAYGSRGHPPKVPPETTLVFELQLLGVRK